MGEIPEGSDFRRFVSSKTHLHIMGRRWAICVQFTCSICRSCSGILCFRVEGLSHPVVYDVDDGDLRRGEHGVLCVLPLPAKGIGRQLLDVDGFRSNDGNRWRSNDESALPADDDALLHLLGWFGLCGWEEWEG